MSQAQGITAAQRAAEASMVNARIAAETEKEKARIAANTAIAVANKGADASQANAQTGADSHKYGADAGVKMAAEREAGDMARAQLAASQQDKAQTVQQGQFAKEYGVKAETLALETQKAMEPQAGAIYNPDTTKIETYTKSPGIDLGVDAQGPTLSAAHASGIAAYNQAKRDQAATLARKKILEDQRKRLGFTE
jgi:hypothetical protein